MTEPAVRLQRATMAEHSALAALMLEANRHYWGVVEGAAEMTAKAAQAIIQGRSGVGAYLILDAGSPVGFATVSILHPASTEAGTFFMKDLYVSGATRGRGLGRVAMHLLATEAMRLGCQRFDWTAERDNPGALAFYDAFGAERVEDKVYFRLSGDRLQRAAAPDRMKG